MKFTRNAMIALIAGISWLFPITSYGEPANTGTVTVFLNESGLSSATLETYPFVDLEATLEKRLKKQNAGYYEGFGRGEKGRILYFHGANAEQLFGVIERTLRKSPLCKGARVMIRQGKGTQREIKL